MPNGVRADRAMSYSEIGSTAGLIRQYVGCGPLDRFPHLEFFESTLNDLHTPTASGEIRFYFGAKEMAGQEGLTYYNEDKRTLEMYLSESSYNEFTWGYPRAVFAAAHELGHALLHSNQLIRLASLHIEQKAAFHRQIEEYKSYWDTEWQANAFAAALLVPYQGLAELKERRGGFLFGEDITNTYGVSFTAASHRIKVFNDYAA